MVRGCGVCMEKEGRSLQDDLWTFCVPLQLYIRCYPNQSRKKTRRNYSSSISGPEAIYQSSRQLIRRGAGWLQDNLHDSDMMPGSCLCQWGKTGHNRVRDVTGEWRKARIRIRSHVCRGEKGLQVLATSSLMCTIASCQKLPHEPNNTGSFRVFR
jgi:hypothetical protein